MKKILSVLAGLALAGSAAAQPILNPTPWGQDFIETSADATAARANLGVTASEFVATDGDYGDVVVGSGGTSWTLDYSAAMRDALGTFKYINAKTDHGATGDGATDDATAIQNALTAASTAGGGVVYLPEGHYRLDSELRLYHNTILMGSRSALQDSTPGTFLEPSATFTGDAVIEHQTWTDNTYGHFGGVRGLTIRGENNVDYGIKVHRPGENFILRDIHFHKLNKSGLWMTGNAATFRGVDLVFNSCGDKAIRITGHPTHTGSYGNWAFDHISGDMNTNGWFLVSQGATISVNHWKIEDNSAGVFDAPKDATILLTDQTYDGIAAYPGSWRVVFSVDHGTVSVVNNPGWTNWVWIEDTGGNIDVQYSQENMLWSYVPDYYIWQESTGDGIAGADGMMGNVFTTLDMDLAYKVPELHLQGNLNLSSTGVLTNVADAEIEDDLTVGGQTLAARGGGASAPEYSFADDPDSGWYQSGNAEIRLALNGAEKFNVGSTAFNVKTALFATDAATVNQLGGSSGDFTAYADNTANYLQLDASANSGAGGVYLNGLTLEVDELATFYNGLTVDTGTATFGSVLVDGVYLRLSTTNPQIDFEDTDGLDFDVNVNGDVWSIRDDAHADIVTVDQTGNVTGDGSFYSANTSGGGRFGNAGSYMVAYTGNLLKFNSDLLPTSNNTRDLGSAALSWADGHFDGTLNAAGLTTGTDGSWTVDEHATAPGTPSAGNVVVYAKADGKLYIKDDTGTETDLTSGVGGGGTPGGSDTQVQYNDSGSFAGDAGMTYNAATDALTLAGDLSLSAGNLVMANNATMQGQSTSTGQLKLFNSTTADIEIRQRHITIGGIGLYTDDTQRFYIDHDGAVTFGGAAGNRFSIDDTAASISQNTTISGNKALIVTGEVRPKVGVEASPGIDFGDSGVGLFRSGTWVVMTEGGVARSTLGSGVGLGSGGTINWSSSTRPTSGGGSASDVGLERSGAGILEVTDGSTGYGTLSLGNLVTSADSVWNVDEHSSAPATPSTGRVVVYAKADGKLYIKDDTGTETDLTAGGGSFDVDALTEATEADIGATDLFLVSDATTEKKITADNFQDWLESLTLNWTSASATTFKVLDNVDQSHGMSIVANENLTGDINLNLDLDGASRNVNIQGNATLNDWFDQSVKTTASPTFDGATFTANPTYSSAAISASDIDWSESSHYKTLAANTTFTFSNDSNGQTIVVAIVGASTYTVTWPGTVKWPGGTAPTQTVDATDVYTFVKINGVVYGSAVQDLQ